MWMDEPLGFFPDHLGQQDRGMAGMCFVMKCQRWQFQLASCSLDHSGLAMNSQWEHQTFRIPSLAPTTYFYWIPPLVARWTQRTFQPNRARYIPSLQMLLPQLRDVGQSPFRMSMETKSLVTWSALTPLVWSDQLPLIVKSHDAI